jgi:biopolymer transport protein ExbB/TolQ
MPEPGVSTVVILLGTITGLLFLLLLTALRIGSRLWRVEKLLEGQREAESAVRETQQRVPDVNPNGAFEEFLREDPARRDLSKSEQFSAYRKWRQERGLNWSGS